MQSALIRLGLICALFLIALAAGYALSSSLGQGVLRREAEAQLAKLMRGRVAIDRADLRIRSGLWIEGRGVHVYPSPDGPGLSSKRVSVRIDVLALLTGRFRVQDLILDGIHMEIERTVADRWTPYPINAIDMRGQGGDPDDLERKLGAFRAIDVITRVLLERPFIAQRIEVTNGSVHLIDRHVRAKGMPPLRAQIDSIHGSLAHDWIGNRAELKLAGRLSDETRTHVPIEIAGERRTDGSMALSVAATKLELENYRDYFWDRNADARPAPGAGQSSDDGTPPFAGMLSAVVRFDTPARDHGVLEIDSFADGAQFGLLRGDELLRFASPRLQLRARLEIHPGRLRIDEATLRGPDIRIELSGDIERPLRGSSAADLAIALDDVGPDTLTRLADALPANEREPALRALSSIEDGRIVRIGGRGKERFSVWQAVLRGDRLDLPAGISLMAAVADVTIQLGEHERLTDLSGSATWTRDRIQILGARAQRNGTPTPRLNLTIDGFPVLFEQTTHFDDSRVSSAGLSGTSLLDQIFAPESVADGESRADQLIKFEIDIDYLEHSALLWPLRNARIEAVAQEHSRGFDIVEGTWGSAHLNGDVLFTDHSEPTVDAHVEVWAAATSKPTDAEDTREPPEARIAQPADTTAEEAAQSPHQWAAGRLRVEGLHGKHWPVGPTAAAFSLTGEALDLEGIRGRLVPRGTLEGNVRLDLARSDQLAFETRFRILNGEAGSLTEAVGFPSEFATGALDVEAALWGPIVPDKPALAEVVGQLTIEARDGEVRQSIPLAAALAHAAEGLNPARAGDAIAYGTLSTVLQFDRGSIATEEIKLDGPLRIFLSGRFDFAKPEREIDGEIGIFIFRQVDQLLGNVPLLGNLIPGGKDRGLFGAFFSVDGTLEEPLLQAMPMKSLTDGVPLPDLVKAPFSAIRQALQGKPKRAP